MRVGVTENKKGKTAGAGRLAVQNTRRGGGGGRGAGREPLLPLLFTPPPLLISWGAGEKQAEGPSREGSLTAHNKPPTSPRACGLPSYLPMWSKNDRLNRSERDLRSGEAVTASPRAAGGTGREEGGYECRTPRGTETDKGLSVALRPQSSTCMPHRDTYRVQPLGGSHHPSSHPGQPRRRHQHHPRDKAPNFSSASCGDSYYSLRRPESRRQTQFRSAKPQAEFKCERPPRALALALLQRGRGAEPAGASRDCSHFERKRQVAQASLAPDTPDLSVRFITAPLTSSPSAICAAEPALSTPVHLPPAPPPERVPRGNMLAGRRREGAEGAAAAAHALSLPAEAYGNDPQLEMMWAMKAYQHAEIYFNLISSVDPKFLKLTKVDDKICTEFRKAFPDLNIKVLDPEDLKSEQAKEKWRPFCNLFEGVVEDFNYGTLLRLDCERDYTEENTIFATRIQFFAIEIARNREGYNSAVFEASTKGKSRAVGEHQEQS
ncbi:PBDC1 protein, partial [Atractosteus spatula]|nr:PBDC1 protein [Atractosteus spatula]